MKKLIKQNPFRFGYEKNGATVETIQELNSFDEADVFARALVIATGKNDVTYRQLSDRETIAFYSPDDVEFLKDMKFRA